MHLWNIIIIIIIIIIIMSAHIYIYIYIWPRTALPPAPPLVRLKCAVMFYLTSEM